MSKPLDLFPGIYSDGVRCKVHSVSGWGPRRNEVPKFDPRPEYEQDRSKY